ncbi:MAG: hypothetical protein V3V01_06850, partial [Acidimicrobiales bacterium]
MSDVWPPPTPDSDVLTSPSLEPESPPPTAPSNKRLWLAALGTGLVAGLFALLLWGLAADNTPVLTEAATGAAETAGPSIETESG